MAAPRSGRAGLRAAFALFATILFTAPAWGQSASNGGALYTTHCAGCHSSPQSPYPAQQNGASAPAVIKAAISANMMGVPAWTADPQYSSDVADIAAFILSGNPPTQPVSTPTTNNVNVPFNTAQGFTAPAVVITPNYLAGGYAVLTSIVVVTPPTKGNVVFSGQNGTYTPNANQFGSDSFTWRATNGAVSTSLRTTTISIANPPAPTLTPGTITGVTGTAITTFNIAASPFATSCNAGSALPAGLVLGFSGGNCTISGTPTATASGATVQITGTNAGGTGAAATFTFNISLGLPAITSGTPPAGQELVSYTGSYTITASNAPFTSYGGTGLPPGLSVNSGTGQVQGTPSLTAGPWPQTYNATLSATNTTGTGSASRTFTINKPVPQLSGTATASGQTGVAFNYAVAASPGPITGYNATGLPLGLSINSSGQIVGTPTTVGGPTVATITATNSSGTSAGFTVAITITQGPPAINSVLAASAGEGQSFSYQITGTNSPTSFNATGLPSGLTVNTTTGAISGTPAGGTAAGSPYNVTISATNATGTGSATLVISLSQFPPVVSSATTASGQTGVAFTYQITASNAPTAYSASPLPAGLAINTGTGQISGTPTAVGTFPVTIGASNGSGGNTATLTITITLGPPVITSGPTASGAAGFALSYQITATNSPTSFNATGLPPGLSVSTASGLISGTPTTNGTFTANVTAANGTATASKTVTFTIAFGLPSVTSPATVTAATGSAFTYQITATNAPTSFAAFNLPQGLSVDTTTGVISGQVVNFGVYDFTVQASNATGSATRQVSLTVSQSAPGMTSATTATAAIGQAFTFQVSATNGPVRVDATGLPPGLAIDPASGLISGTPTAGGTYPVALTIANTRGTVTATLTITIPFKLPTVQDVSQDVVYETPTVITLLVAGQGATVAIASQPEHGLVVLNGGTVTYTPADGYFGTDAFTYTATNPAGTTAAATVHLNVTPLAPTAGVATMVCDINSTATSDLKKFIKGSGLTGIAVTTLPTHGTVAVNGTQVTYTPKTDYFGPDAFAYVAFGNAGKSAPAVVSVTVIGRPDPTKDANVTGIMDAQAQSAKRFTAAQVGNFTRRMETLHRIAPNSAANAEERKTPVATPAAAVSPEATVPGAATTSAVSKPAADKNDGRASASPNPMTGLLNLIAPAMSTATTRALDLNGVSAGGGGSEGWYSGFTAWIGGTAQFGRRDAKGEVAGLEFSTDGISVGFDRRVSQTLVLGLGIGYGRDDTDVGTQGSRSKAKGQSFALYGSFQPSASTFIDMLLGAGSLDFDTRRYVAALDQFASGHRKGDQAFASVVGGLELRRDNMLLSPYGRIDLTRDKLKAYADGDVGDYALSYDAMTVKSTQFAAGLRYESQHDADFGGVVPRARVEYRREFQDDARGTLRYLDLASGPQYSVTTTGVSRNALLLGVGSDFVFRGGLKLGIDYTAQRASGASNVQAVRILVSQDLDARGSPFSWQPTMLKDSINVEAGYTYDDNVSRGRVDAEKRSDSIFSLSAGQPMPFKLGSLSHLRLVVTPSLGVERFKTWSGLGRYTVGAQGELQYRSSGAFDAITLALVGRAAYDDYDSEIRRGGKYFLGFNARRSLTDRIDLFAEAGRQMREGKSEVFQTREWLGKLNLDYSLGGRRGVLYLSGEYRKGDIVSSGVASLANIGLADVFVPDDAFNGLFAYRFDGHSVLGTIGWNYPLGPRDSLDFSWRRVESTPSGHTKWDSGTLRYIDNQYSLVYLMRF